MTGLRISRRAQVDLDETWLYIAEDNIDAANRLRRDLESRFLMLSRQPLLGESREDLGKDIRQFTVRSRVILYAFDETRDRVEIIRVVHGARNIPDLFQDDEEPE